ncbi:hypothetical protein SAMN05421753_101145 [Planctomicrobium piriforme]|uniref:Uncharacterized protein n=1 Tax=Planctomicrobium piriforme TaxID=1576369 RepID=A0A1I3B010_9PLAN|nr:hypothetical protein SAMN05421753_101145 [Planctomicrobium piriforme]
MGTRPRWAALAASLATMDASRKSSPAGIGFAMVA